MYAECSNQYHVIYTIVECGQFGYFKDSARGCYVYILINSV